MKCSSISAGSLFGTTPQASLGNGREEAPLVGAGGEP